MAAVSSNLFQDAPSTPKADVSTSTSTITPTLSAQFQALTGLQFMYRDQHVNSLVSIYQQSARNKAPDVVFMAPVSNLERASLVDIFRGGTVPERFGTNFKMPIPIHIGAQDAGHWTGVFVSVDTNDMAALRQRQAELMQAAG